MKVKAWSQLREKLEKLPAEERVKQLQILGKKEKNSAVKKEIRELLSRAQQQVSLTEEWYGQGLARVQAIQEAEQTPLTTAEEELTTLSKQATLEEVLAATPTPIATTTLTETTLQYGPNANYIHGADYSPATAYFPNQYSLLPDSVAAQVLAEQVTSVQSREQEEEKQRSVGSQKESLATREFAEYKRTQRRQTQ